MTTNAELAILSLLAEQPRHGYDIEQVIEMRGMREWTEVGFSSIYYVLKKLEQAGWIESRLEEAGRGPARKVYHITEVGSEQMKAAILESLSMPQRCFPPLLLGISTLPGIPAEAAVAALRQYIAELDKRLSHAKARWEAQKPLPYFVEALFTYSITLAQTERDWIEQFIKEVEAKRHSVRKTLRFNPIHFGGKMTVQPLPGFKHFTTHHCGTGSMRHVYEFNGYPISEDLLLGLGAGVSFIYFHYKGQPPFMGGLGMPKPSAEEIAGRRTGVKIAPHTTSSARKAKTSLVALLTSGQPVMLQVDMGFLPYFDFGGQEYHFGGHSIVACGYNLETDEVLIADREEALHPVPMADLEKARGSTFKPFPPKNSWWTFDFSEKRPPTADEVRQAILDQAGPMLEPPISNLGVKGIRKAAQTIPKWPETMDADALRWAMFNGYIFISPVGGTGGGLFRYMFSRFLQEAAEIMNEPKLETAAAEFKAIADQWAQLGEWFRTTSEMPDAAARMEECAGLLNTLAEMELAGWAHLRERI
ncbi:MAG: DUF4872 domain-containing protein [Anaerolineae bacterium]|nr:DUF4872 domain-containing protein [Anaerolineae bacterium]